MLSSATSDQKRVVITRGREVLVVASSKRPSPADWRRMRFLFKLIADPVDEVAPWLALKIEARPRHGQRIAWMTVPKAVLRFFRPKYHRRDLFADEIPDSRYLP